MREQLQLGLVGAGAIAQSYLKALENVPFARIVAVADTRREAALATAEGAGCAGFGSHQEMAEHADLDAVILCTPPATHADIALHFIGLGLPVLCEKPLSVDLASAQRMISAAERKGVQLTMASKFRYCDDVIKARALIASGSLGDIVAVENAFSGKVDMTSRWNSNPALSGGGVLIDNGTHSVDIMRYLVGPITQVFAAEGRRTQPIPVDDSATVMVRTKSGAAGTIDLSWSLDKALDYFITVHGTHGIARIGWRKSVYKRVNMPAWEDIGTGYDKIAAFRNTVSNFCGALQGREQMLISAEDALASVQVIQAAYTSLATGAWQSIG